MPGTRHHTRLKRIVTSLSPILAVRHPTPLDERTTWLNLTHPW